MINTVKYFLLFLLVAFSIQMFGQGAYITVLDKKTKQPVPFAHVCFESPDKTSTDYEITDVDGRALNKARKPNTNISVSFVGFEPYESTIRPNEPKTIYLVPQIFGLGETVVTGQYKPEKVDQSIYKIQVIGAKQIAEKGAVDLADLLNNESNIQIKQDGVLGTSLKMQGMTGENVKILVDGVPVIGRMNGNIDLGQIDLSNVDHVEIVEGPMSVVYGTNALAGTINIITKVNKRNIFEASVKNYYESIGEYNFDANASVKKGIHSATINAGRNFSPPFKLYDSSRVTTFKPKEQYKFGADYNLLKENFKLRYNLSFFKETILDLGFIDTIEADNEIYANDKYFYTNRLTNSLNFDKNLGENNYFSLLGAYSYYDRIKRTMVKHFADLSQTLSDDMSTHDTTRFMSFMSRGTFSNDNNALKLKYQAGFDINIDDAKGKRIYDSTKTMMEDYALFFSLKYKLLGENTIQPGIRLIKNTKYKAPVIPSINLKWELLPGLNARLSYAKGFRAPSLKELYLDFVDANHNIHGNKDLKAEISNSYNFSVNYLLEKDKHSYEADLSAFYNDGKNVIALVVVDPAVNYYANKNIDVRQTEGIRFNLNYNLYPRLTVKSGVSLTGVSETLSMRDSNVIISNTDTSVSYFNRSFLGDYQYTTDYNLNVNYRFINYDLLLSVFYKYNGESNTLYVDEDEETHQEIINYYTINPYNSLDVSLTKKFFQNRFSVVLGAKNLFDNKTILTSSGYDPNQVHGGGGGSNATPVAWGRTYFVSITYRFTKN